MIYLQYSGQVVGQLYPDATSCTLVVTLQRDVTTTSVILQPKYIIHGCLSYLVQVSGCPSTITQHSYGELVVKVYNT
jgi:hypothetical protein